MREPPFRRQNLSSGYSLSRFVGSWREEGPVREKKVYVYSIDNMKEEGGLCRSTELVGTSIPPPKSVKWLQPQKVCL